LTKINFRENDRGQHGVQRGQTSSAEKKDP